MAYSPSHAARKETNPSPRSAPMQSTNNDIALSHSGRRLSLSTPSTTALPPSSQPASASKALGQRNLSSSPNGKVVPRSPLLHRSPSAMSLDARSSTPTLLRKASMNSLHGIGGVTPPRSSPSRRSSSAQVMNGSTSAMFKSPLSGVEDAPEAPPRYTAASIASAHFKAELDLHNQDEEGRRADTVVILHDSCYGHRYSRPRTSRAALSTIVERPERIQASVLGVSVAFVRLGERHAGGQYPLHPNKDASTIPNIPFRIHKTSRKLSLSSPAVTNVHGIKWMEELKTMCDTAEAKLAMNGKELTRPDIIRSTDQAVPAKLHEGDLYLCSESLTAMEGALGAVCEGVDAVFQGSASGKGPHRTFVAIRPPGHHCSASYPSGFCWLNNVHVGIAHAALAHGLTHAAIIDFDLHHGDGSQAIAWEHNARAMNLPKNAVPWKKTSIGYFSLHDINSYPCEMGDEEKVKNASLCIENAHGQSIWNVHLQPWKSESEFWNLYQTKYSILLEKTRNYLRTQTERLRASPNLPTPKAAIFLSAGFDASEWESSGMQRHKVNVPTEFYARLTRDVVEIAAEEGTAVDGRVISVLEGGYSDRALCTGVFSHISGLAGGDPIVIEKEVEHTGLGYEMGQKIGAFNGTDKSITEAVSSGASYDPLWWSLPRLEQLDALVNPPLPAPEPRKPRDTTPPTYSSPTQSFSAKIVVSPRIQRSVSSAGRRSPGPKSRAPSPPPPEVDWTVAAHELSKLLIPSGRQISSCKPEDLSAEATRARRDRQSILTPPTITEGLNSTTLPSTRMALRERKPVKPSLDTLEDDEAKKRAAKVNRRKTVADAMIIPAEKAPIRSSTPKPEPSYSQPTKQSARRLSTASTAGSVISEAPTSRPLTHSRAPSTSAATIPHRPGSSQSIRPDSSMSSRGHSIPPVVVKKVRAPAQPRNDQAKISRVRRKSPLGGNDGSGEAHSRSASVASVAPANPQGSDMDMLTSGIKKIKINLTTKTQRDLKEPSKPAKLVPARASSKAVLIKPEKSRQNGDPNITAHEQSSPKPQPSFESNKRSVVAETPDCSLTEHMPPEPSTPPARPSQLPAHLREATQVPLPASSPPDPVPDKAILAPSNSGSVSDLFIPYQPEGPPPSTMNQQEPLRWLPPNTSTPAPTPMKRVDLPVFTSTSAIPFGVNPNLNNGGPKPNGDHLPRQHPESQDSIWEVPETPRK